MAAPGEEPRGIGDAVPPFHPADQESRRETSPIRMNPINTPALRTAFR